MAIDTCVENFSGAARVTTHGLRYRPVFRMIYA
jgi:hypothetical protein